MSRTQALDDSFNALASSADLEALGEAFEEASASEIVAWAAQEFGEGLVLAASFQDCVLIDIAARVDSSIVVVFLDTGFQFKETLAYAQRVRQRYDLNLRTVGPSVAPDEWPCGSDRCCEVRKVQPFKEAVAGKRAWMSGLRRSETPERSYAPIVSFDQRHGLIKVNPLATWSDEDVDAYILENDLPVHPLRYEGYLSIGCAPTTRPVMINEDQRAGRWPGQLKTECGLHL